MTGYWSPRRTWRGEHAGRPGQRRDHCAFSADISDVPTLELAWRLLDPFADDQLGRIPAALRDRYGRGIRERHGVPGAAAPPSPPTPGSRK